MKMLWGYRQVVLLAILIRLLLMPFLYHPDLKTQYFHAQFLRVGVVNIYQYIRDNKANLPYKDTFNYPPLTYWLLGSYSAMVSLVLDGNYHQWLNDWGENGFTSVQIYRQLLVLKLPYLVLDLVIAGILLELVNLSRRKYVLILWLFNPISLYIIYGLSNFDILPTALSVLALLALKKDQFIRSGFWLGLAVATKLYPLLFFPLIAIYLFKQNQIQGLIKFGSVLALVFFSSIFWVWSDFLSIQGSGLLSLVLVQGFDFFGQHIPYFGVLYGLGLVAMMVGKLDFRVLVKFLIYSLFLVYSLSHFHPQWLLWSWPLLVWLVSESVASIWILGVIGIAFAMNILTFHDRYLTLGLLSPIFPSIYQVADLEAIVLKGLNDGLVIHIAEVIFGLSLISLWRAKRIKYD